MEQKHGKDCLQTVLAAGLQIDYDSIPKFYENDETWQSEYDKWLHENGLFRVIINATFNNIEIPYCSKQLILMIGILHRDPNEYDHAVILRKVDDTIHMNDPKPDSEYDLTDLIQVEIIFKFSYTEINP